MVNPGSDTPLLQGRPQPTKRRLPRREGFQPRCDRRPRHQRDHLSLAERPLRNQPYRCAPTRKRHVGATALRGIPNISNEPIADLIDPPPRKP